MKTKMIRNKNKSKNKNKSNNKSKTYNRKTRKTKGGGEKIQITFLNKKTDGKPTSMVRILKNPAATAGFLKALDSYTDSVENDLLSIANDVIGPPYHQEIIDINIGSKNTMSLEDAFHKLNSNNIMKWPDILSNYEAQKKTLLDNINTSSGKSTRSVFVNKLDELDEALDTVIGSYYKFLGVSAMDTEANITKKAKDANDANVAKDISTTQNIENALAGILYDKSRHPPPPLPISK